MQTIFAVVVFAVVLAIASADVAEQAKKSKVKKAAPAKGSSYLNVWLYGSSDCSGTPGLAVSIPNRSCWVGDACDGRRRELVAAEGAKKFSAKASTILSEVFSKKMVSGGKSAKLQELLEVGAAFQVGFSQNTIGGESTFNTFGAEFTDLSCTTWVHDEASASFNVMPLSDYITLDTCVNGNSGFPYKYSISTEPAIPSYDGAEVAAVSLYNNENGCDAGAYGAKGATVANGLDTVFFFPLGGCTYDGAKVTINGGNADLKFFENRDCTGNSGDYSFGPINTCAANSLQIAELGDRCGYLRVDVVPAGKKGSPKSAALRV